MHINTIFHFKKWVLFLRDLWVNSRWFKDAAIDLWTTKLVWIQSLFHLKAQVWIQSLFHLKAQQSLPGQPVNGEGLWLNSLDYLPVCYTQRSMLTVLYVGYYQSVTRNSNNSSGYVYNRELITQPTPIQATAPAPPTGLYSPVALLMCNI